MKKIEIKDKKIEEIQFFKNNGIEIDKDVDLNGVFLDASVLTAGSVKRCVLIPAFADAILELVNGSRVAIGTDSGNKVCVEYTHDGVTEVAADCQTTAESGYWFKAETVNQKDNSRLASTLPDIIDEQNSEELMFFVILGEIFNSSREELEKVKAHLISCFETIKQAIKDKFFDEKATEALAVATAEMQAVINNTYVYTDVSVDGIRKLLKSEEQQHVPMSDVGYGTDQIDQLVKPKFKYLIENEEDETSSSIPKKLNFKKAVDLPEFKEFRENIRKTLTEQELSLIPKIPEKFPVEPEAMQIAYNVCTYSKLGFENAADAILRGEPGSGKTTAAKMVAALLGLPYLVLSCSAGSDELTVLGGVLPKTEDENKDSDTIIGWQAQTSVEEILFEPDKAYEHLTGVKSKGKSPEQVFQWAMSHSELFRTDTKFEAVASPLVKALNKGWLVEIQEPTLIRDPGVLPKLNSFLEDNIITTDSGKTYTRNGGVCIITTNVNCAGCTPLNASVQSRFTNVFEMDIPSAAKLKARIKAELNFEDNEILKLMIKTVSDMNEYLNQNMVYDGACGYRELRNWVMAFMYDLAVKGDAYNSCITTVVNKATCQLEYKQDLLNILNKYF